MGFESIKKIKNLQELVQDQIKLYIIESGLKNGDCLPTEIELAYSLGISRTSIREALTALETIGIIEKKHGIGRFIRNFNFEVILKNLPYKLEIDINNFLDIIEVRYCLESWFITKDIEKYSDADIRKLKRIMDELEELVNEGNQENPLIDKHTEFHCELYCNSHNRLIIDLVKIFATVQKNLTILHRYETNERKLFIDRHKKIIEAIERRDPQLAQKRLIEHFTEAKEWVEHNVGQGSAVSIGNGIWYKNLK